MAVPLSMCAPCLRASRNAASRVAIRSTNTRSTSARAYSKAAVAATSRSLYLDFLIPANLRQSTRPSVLSLATYRDASAQKLLRRTLATTSDVSTARQAQAIQNPRKDDDGKPIHINISPRASNRLHAISSGDNNPNLALRVSIESGGCHGFQYLMDLTDLQKSPASEEDTVFQGDKGEKVVVDEASLELLNGSTVDYTMELIGSQFKIMGIPGATSSCGCGTSFDIKL
ncbi:hypothetical protein EK21DRAFT_114261 [Setomelanomma holmii]|uniref:Core domain-containing protein n=1 Tax=Setomelanomma holmii TaxID=210430 RepID=A0A9P4H4I2_9PLEO|nr:hypothetical protein EK21DRAFT_114261 [Setomelanomma holmii]